MLYHCKKNLQYAFVGISMVNKKAIEPFLVYLGVVTLAISQPLFNIVTLYRHHFDISLMDVILIIVVFQYGLTGKNLPLVGARMVTVGIGKESKTFEIHSAVAILQPGGTADHEKAGS